jgi:hypothetical protein
MSNQIQKEFQYICSPQGMSGKDEGPPISGASPIMNHRNMTPVHSNQKKVCSLNIRLLQMIRLSVKANSIYTVSCFS